MYKYKTLLITSVTAMRGIATRKDIERALYSDSILYVAMHVCNLKHQMIGQPMTSGMKPVRDLTGLGFVPCSIPHPLAKALLI